MSLICNILFRSSQEHVLPAPRSGPRLLADGLRAQGAVATRPAALLPRQVRLGGDLVALLALHRRALSHQPQESGGRHLLARLKVHISAKKPRQIFSLNLEITKILNLSQSVRTGCVVRGGAGLYMGSIADVGARRALGCRRNPLAQVSSKQEGCPFVLRRQGTGEISNYAMPFCNFCT